MASITNFNREIGIIGDNIIINGNNCVVRNNYKLITNENNEKYYEIKLHNYEGSFIIDEDIIEKVLSVIVNDKLYQCRWYYSNYTVMAYLTGDKRMFLGKYLLNNLDGDLKVFHKNLNKLDFKMNNLELKTQSEINSLAHKKRKPVAKPKKLEFFNNKDKTIIETVERECDFNNYELKKIDETDEEYYEMIVSDDITFIFDKESLEVILLLHWHIRNGYISSNIPRNTGNSILQLFKSGSFIYLHTYLMKLNGFEIPDGSSIDHINFNKFDNRLCNLRVATQSEQNSNRPNVERSILIPEPLKANLELDHNEIPMYIHLLKPRDGHASRFEVEFSAFDINGVKQNIQCKTTSKNSLNIIEKLCNGIAIRYNLILEKNIDITRLTIDGLKFNTNTEFLDHSNLLIHKFMSRINQKDINTIESFNKYLKIQLFNRASITTKKKIISPKKIENTEAAVASGASVAAGATEASVATEATEAAVTIADNDDDVAVITKSTSKKTRIPRTQIIPKPIIDETKYTITLKDEMMIDFENIKPAYINYVKPKEKRSSTFDGEINVCSKPRKKLVISGSTHEILDLNERLAWSLVKRYSVFVIQENSVNELLERNEDDNIIMNKNTTSQRTLTNFKFNENPHFKLNNKQSYEFLTFEDFKKHTETYISSILNKSITLETFIDYIISKSPKIQKPIITIKFLNLPILTN